ncbi:MAG: hypothetical protein ACRDYV_00220 [Acidimicrobiia bacterium]
MFKMVVEIDGQKVEIPRVAYRELVAFEKHFNQSAGILKEGRLEHVAWLAWAGLRRAGRVNGEVPFDDDFLDRLGLVEVQEADPFSATAETVPTPPSPASPSPST